MTTTTGPRTAPAATLTHRQLGILRRALPDAIAEREPASGCKDCKPGLPCADHAQDREWADDYYDLARELGIRIEEI